MPDRLYISMNHPPKWQDRVAAHWAELLIAVWGIIRGFTTALTPLVPGMVNPTILVLPFWLSLAVSALLMVGGGVWVWSIVNRFSTVNAWWLCQRWGLSLAGFGWLTHVITALGLRPEAFNTWGSAIIMAVVCWGLYVLSFRAERVTRGGRK